MINGKEIILSTKPFAQEIRWKSWMHTSIAMSLFVFALIGTVWFNHLAVRIFCSILAALMVVRTFVIYHDHQHHTILHKSPLANFLFYIYGMYVLAPPSIWKRSHDHHHKHNSKLLSASIGSYPIMTKEKFLSATPKEKFAYLASRHWLTMVFGYFTMFVYGMCIQSFINNPKKHIDSLLALILHIAWCVFVVHYFGWTSWLLMIFIPFFIAFMIGAYLFYAQHNFPGVKFNLNEKWKYEEAALLSSSYLKMNAVMRWFSANIGFHHVHHLNAKIPFYRLPEAMKNIPALQKPTVTTFKIKDIISCLRLKVWDEELGRMVGLKAIRIKS
ncbi:MAG: fatty acid desaturase family protein [Bacteroidia bacterium]